MLWRLKYHVSGASSTPGSPGRQWSMEQLDDEHRVLLHSVDAELTHRGEGPKMDAEECHIAVLTLIRNREETSGRYAILQVLFERLALVIVDFCYRCPVCQVM